MVTAFLRYALIGIANTAIHWIVFSILVILANARQAYANLGAFCVAVTFSYFMNARFTFGSAASARGYFSYIAFMGALAAATGYVADIAGWPALITLATFSSLSLLVGFLYSRLAVFRVTK